MGQQTDNHDGAGQVEVRTRRWNVSLVWIVPIVAILIGASLVVRNWMQQGPVIAIAFHTGEGLVAHKTQVKYRSVVIGEVTTVELADDKKSVVAKVQLSNDARAFATQGRASGWCGHASGSAAFPGGYTVFGQFHRRGCRRVQGAGEVVCRPGTATADYL